MKKRETVVLDPKYGPYAEEEAFDVNRADSIEWARRQSGAEARRLFELRDQFCAQLEKDFPRERGLVAIVQHDDLTNFLVVLGQLCEHQYSAALRAMARFYCDTLKAEMNLDLYPSTSEAVRV